MRIAAEVVFDPGAVADLKRVAMMALEMYDEMMEANPDDAATEVINEPDLLWVRELLRLRDR